MVIFALSLYVLEGQIQGGTPYFYSHGMIITLESQTL